MIEPAPTSARVPRSVVVVGAGLAGARTASRLRGLGFAGRLTVVGDEPLAPYDRPPLSKHLLDRPQPTWLADDLDIRLSELADEVLLGVAAVGIDAVARAEHPTYRVALRAADGAPRTLEADAVVLACGSRPVRPAGWEDALVLHTVDDADRLRARLAEASAAGGRRHVVCVGAGWIGAELAGVLTDAGTDVTVVEAAPVPLAAALGEHAGRLTLPWYDERPGLRLVTGANVVAVRPGGVDLGDGTTISADVVVAAVGARPATAWLDGTLAGLVDLGPRGAVVVDEQHRPIDATGQPVAGLEGVRVVGDAALRRSPRHGWVAGGHWDAALTGPETAVRSLLGCLDGPAPDPAPYVFSTQLGHELSMFGVPGADDDVVVRGGDERPGGTGGWTALWFAPDDGGPGRTLTAALAVDRPRDVAAARRLFAGAELPRLDPAVAADPDSRLR